MSATRRRPACRLIGLAVVLGAAAAVGCRGPEGRYGRRSGPGSEGSTVGSDLRQAAPGTTILPPSIGVDLVDYATDRPGWVTRAVATPSAAR